MERIMQPETDLLHLHPFRPIIYLRVLLLKADMVAAVVAAAEENLPVEKEVAGLAMTIMEIQAAAAAVAAAAVKAASVVLAVVVHLVYI